MRSTVGIKNREVSHLQHHVSGRCRVFIDSQLNRTTNHHFCNLRLCCGLWIYFSNHFATTQHRNTICNVECFFQLVRNEDHAASSGNQCLYDFKKLNNFTWRKYCCRFVEHHNFCVAQQYLHDFNALLNANWQILNDSIGVEIEAVLVGNFTHHSARFINIQFPKCTGRLYTEHHVFSHGEYGNEHEVLVDHADTRRDCICWRSKHL